MKLRRSFESGLCYLILLLAWASADSMLFSEERIDDLVKREAVSTAAKFLLNIGAGSWDNAADTCAPEIAVQDVGFEPTHGRVVSLQHAETLLQVSIDDRRVISAIFRDRTPRSMPVVDREGRPISKEEMRSALVGCSLEQARTSATLFLKEGFGEEVLMDVELEEAALRYQGSFFVYAFTWREQLDEDGVARLFKWLNVNVNPESCMVSQFGSAESRPSSEVDIGVTEVRRIVAESSSNCEHLSISRLNLIELQREEGAPIPAWRAVFECGVGVTLGISANARRDTRSYCIDARSGEVFHSARELLEHAEGRSVLTRGQQIGEEEQD